VDKLLRFLNKCEFSLVKMKEYKRPHTPGLRLERSEGQVDIIRHIPTNYTIELVIKKINKLESVTLDCYGMWYYGKWYLGEKVVEEGKDTELAEGLAVRIHDFRNNKVCLQYIGSRDIYKILRGEIVGGKDRRKKSSINMGVVHIG
jgi:hypothetical protein